MRILRPRRLLWLLAVTVALAAVPASAGFPVAVHDLAATPAGFTVIGHAAGAQLGTSVASGDFNGDGVDDMLAGAPEAVSAAGRAYVTFGSPGLAGTRDLADAPGDFVVQGAEAGDRLGQAVASGDFNADGFDDLLLGAVGADGNNNTRSAAGEAFVIYGSASLAGVFDLATTAPALRVIGAEAADSLGIAVASGDFNDDGRDDVLLGAREADGSLNARDTAGEAYVIYGANSWDVSDLALGQHNLRVIGAEAFDFLGESVAAGDFNNDGRDDVLLGATGADGAANARGQAGEAYVIYGASNWGVSDLFLGEHNLRVIGGEALDFLGGSVASGDFNDDGRDDVVLGATGADGTANARAAAGEVYVIFGADNWGVSDIALGEHNLRVIGAEASDLLGRSVASGDFNDDGRDDLLMAAIHADGQGNVRSNAGEAYVIYGAANWGVSDLFLGEHDLRVIGGDVNDEVGISLAGGDFDGGGRDDVLVAAPVADGPANARDGAGEVYVIHGLRCQGNINGDASVTIADIAEVVGSFGRSRAANPTQWSAGQHTLRDLNGDWAVTAGDIALAVSFFGDICP
jgi:hypothetical protein